MNRRRFAGLLGGVLGLALLFGFAQLASSGAAMTGAAEKLVGSLTPEQRSLAVLDYDAPARTDWHYIPKNNRKGLQLKDMDDAQRKSAHELLGAALSAAGYGKATKIMSLETLLKELEKSRGGNFVRDPQRYYFTLFGAVAPTGKWGLSVEGHHLSLNFVVDHNQLVSTTPTFFGANPAVLKEDYAPDHKKGDRVLPKEEDLAIQLLTSLTPEQKKTAVIAAKAPNDLRGAQQASPPSSPAEGLPAEEMTPAQKAILLSLIEEYANNVPAEVASQRLQLRELSDRGQLLKGVKFAWQGEEMPGGAHAYRIQGPTLLIELNNTQADSAGNRANHIHSVWHDLKGNFALPVKQ